MGKGTNQIATLGDLTDFNVSVGSNLNKCVNYNEVTNTYKLGVNSSYATKQLVKYSDINMGLWSVGMYGDCTVEVNFYVSFSKNNTHGGCYANQSGYMSTTSYCGISSSKNLPSDFYSNFSSYHLNVDYKIRKQGNLECTLSDPYIWYGDTNSGAALGLTAYNDNKDYFYRHFENSLSYLDSYKFINGLRKGTLYLKWMGSCKPSQSGGSDSGSSGDSSGSGGSW